MLFVYSAGYQTSRKCFTRVGIGYSALQRICLRIYFFFHIFVYSADIRPSRSAKSHSQGWSWPVSYRAEQGGVCQVTEYNILLMTLIAYFSTNSFLVTQHHHNLQYPYHHHHHHHHRYLFFLLLLVILHRLPFFWFLLIYLNVSSLGCWITLRRPR